MKKIISAVLLSLVLSLTVQAAAKEDFVAAITAAKAVVTADSIAKVKADKSGTEAKALDAALADAAQKVVLIPQVPEEFLMIFLGGILKIQEAVNTLDAEAATTTIQQILDLLIEAAQALPNS